MKHRFAFCGAVAAAILLVSPITGCSKDENKSRGQASLNAEPAPKPDALAKTVLTLIPEQSVGFFLWEGKHPAYDKMTKSPWGASENDFAKALQDSSKEWTELREVLEKIGLNPEDKQTWRGLFAEAALFVSPSPDAGKPGAIGVVFRSDPSVKVSDRLNSLKSELGKKELEVKDVKVSVGTAVSIRDKSSPEDGEKVYIGWNKDTAVFGSGEWVLESVLTSKGDKVPALVSNPNFERAARGLPKDANRFATAYVDVQKMIELSDKLGAAGAEGAEKFKAGDIPLKGVSFGMGMDDTPQTNIRLVYDPADRAKNSWLGALNASSTTEILSALPSKPLLFLSLDGKTLRQMREIALASMGEAAAPVKKELVFLDHIKRFGIAARTAAPGQAMIPIPDILIVAESDKPAETQQQLESVVGTIAATSGLGGMPWQDKKIGETAAKSMMTPFGVGVFLASNKNLVLLASTESQLKTALGASKEPTFASALPTRVGDVFVKQDSLGNVYVNFVEVAGLMESMSGLLSMYAPPGSESGQFLQAENIEAMKKMGTIVGSVRLEEGIIGIDSFYEQAKPAA